MQQSSEMLNFTTQQVLRAAAARAQPQHQQQQQQRTALKGPLARAGGSSSAPSRLNHQEFSRNGHSTTTYRRADTREAQGPQQLSRNSMYNNVATAVRQSQSSNTSHNFSAPLTLEVR